MNSEQRITALEKAVDEIMQRLKVRMEAPLPEKIEKLDERIRALEEFRAMLNPGKIEINFLEIL